MIERLAWTLIHSLWEDAAAAALLMVGLLATRRASATARYGLACVVLFLMAVLPAATFLLLAPAAPVGTPTGLTWTPREAVFAGVAPGARLPLLVELWAVGVATLSLRLLGALLHVERLRRRHTRPAEETLQARLNALARRLGTLRPIRLLVSERIAVPSAWGVLRPFVVLPANFVAQWPDEQVDAILLHELAHIRRHDYLVNLAQTVLETVLFYHPAIWWASSVVRREREHCCDDVAVAALGDPMPYARALLHLEERRTNLPHPTLSAKGSNLMNRIARILGAPPAPLRVSPLASTLAALGVLGAVLGGTLQAHAQTTKKPTPRSKAVAKAAPVKKSSPKKAVARTAKPPVSKPVKAAAAPPARVDLLVLPARGAVAGVARPVALAGFAPPRAKAPLVAPSSATGAKPQNRALASKRPSEVAPLSAVQAAPTVGLGAGVPGSPPRGFGGSIAGFSGGGFGGGGSYLPDEDGLTVDYRNGEAEIDVKDARFASVVRKLARSAKLSVVIDEGLYSVVTVVLSDMDAQEALETLCRAGNATYRRQGKVYYITPREVPSPPVRAAAPLGD